MIDIRKWNESAQSTKPQPNSTSCEQDKNERLCFCQKKTRLCRQRGSLSPCDSLNLPKTNRSQLPWPAAGSQPANYLTSNSPVSRISPSTRLQHPGIQRDFSKHRNSTNIPEFADSKRTAVIWYGP